MPIELSKYHWIYNELIYGAYFIALTSSALVLSVAILLNLNFNILSLMISFFITLIVYSFNFQYEVEDDEASNKEKSSFLIKRKKIFPLIILLYIAILLVLSILSSKFGFIVFIIILLTGGVLYTLVFKVLTKSVPSFKSIYVTAMWAYAGTFFNLFYYDLKISYMIILIFIYMFLKLFINVVHFDIKDVASDKIKKLKTIPIVCGVKNTYIILNVINIIALITLLYGIYTKILPLYSISLSLLFAYTSYYLYISKHASNDQIIKYSYIIGDGEALLWPFLLIASKILFSILNIS